MRAASPRRTPLARSRRRPRDPLLLLVHALSRSSGRGIVAAQPRARSAVPGSSHVALPSSARPRADDEDVAELLLVVAVACGQRRALGGGGVLTRRLLPRRGVRAAPDCARSAARSPMRGWCRNASRQPSRSTASASPRPPPASTACRRRERTRRGHRDRSTPARAQKSASVARAAPVRPSRSAGAAPRAARLGVGRAEHAEAADAAVGIDVQPHVRRLGSPDAQLGVEHVQVIGLQLRRAAATVVQSAIARVATSADTPRASSGHDRGLDRRRVRIVALEVRGVELEARMIVPGMPRRTTPSRGRARAVASSPSRRPCSRPGTASACCAARRRSDRSCRRRSRRAAPARDRAPSPAARMRVQSGSTSPMHAQPRHAAVGKDVEPHVREARVRRVAPDGSVKRSCVSPASSLRSRIGCHTTVVGGRVARQPAARSASIQQCDG